jgi:hypothetical protein
VFALNTEAVALPVSGSKVRPQLVSTPSTLPKSGQRTLNISCGSLDTVDRSQAQFATSVATFFRLSGDIDARPLGGAQWSKAGWMVSTLHVSGLS